MMAQLQPQVLFSFCADSPGFAVSCSAVQPFNVNVIYDSRVSGIQNRFPAVRRGDLGTGVFRARGRKISDRPRPR